MSRVFSFRDLKRIPELAGVDELDLLHPRWDATVNKYLGQLGFNLKAPILYVPANHRDMANQTGIGFRAVGEISDDPTFLSSAICTDIERLIVLSRKDMSLAYTLSRMMGHSVNLTDGELAEDEPNLPDEYYEPDADLIEAQLRILVNVRDEVRGSPYNYETGALKSPDEYTQ